MTRAFDLLTWGCLGVAVVAPSGAARAQDTIDVATIQAAARKNDPRAEQIDLLRSATDLRLAVLDAERLPHLELNGWASHQSDITRVAADVPGVSFPTPARDRWEGSLEVRQTIYDGGVISRKRELERARHAESAAGVGVALYALRSEVNAAFFSAFLLQQRAAEFEALVTDLDVRLAAVRARVEAGTALGRDAAEVEAERVKATLQRDEARASRRASLAILADLAGRSIDTAAILVLPPARAEPTAMAENAERIALRLRPEFEQSRRSRARLEREAALAGTENRPQLSAFGQAGYGLPGLDQFRTTADAFWTAGLRIEWRPWTWRSAGRNAAALRLQQRILETEEQALARGLARAVAADIEDINRLTAAVDEDERVVALREEIERQARVQHDEGTITTADYVETRTNVLEARLDLQRHRVELAQARATYLTTLGLP